MKNKISSPMGDDWDILRKSLLTSEERAATDVKIALLDEIIHARKSSGMTQKELEKISGVNSL